MDYEDAAIGKMLFNAYREQVYHAQREGLSVGQSSSSVSDRSGQPVVKRVTKSHDRSGQPVVERGQELNTENAQIRTLLDRVREQILADCQAEIRRHEFHANYDRRSIQNEAKRSNRSKNNFIALKQKNFIDKINNFFMNSC